jgi:hypothetical protein
MTPGRLPMIDGAGIAAGLACASWQTPASVVVLE